jgi:hypothetical protein
VGQRPQLREQFPGRPAVVRSQVATISLDADTFLPKMDPQGLRQRGHPLEAVGRHGNRPPRICVLAEETLARRQREGRYDGRHDYRQFLNGRPNPFHRA